MAFKRRAVLAAKGSGAILELDLLDPVTYAAGQLKAKRGPSIPFARASTAFRFNSAGVLESVASGMPRLDYDPVTLAPTGLLMEQQATNQLRNNSMQGAAAGNPGTLPTNWVAGTGANGITREIVGTGVESGIDYIDFRYSGTASALTDLFINPETTTQVVASNGQTWTFSTFLRVAAGSLPATQLAIVCSGRTSGGADNEATVASVAVTGSALRGQRLSVVKTMASANTAFVLGYIRVRINSGEAVNFILRVGLPQLEQLDIASSVIRTTTAAVTRSTDSAELALSSLPGFSAVAGTSIVGARLDGQRAVGNRVVWNADDGGSTNRITCRQQVAAQALSAIILDASVQQVNMASTVVSGAAFKHAFSWAHNDCGIYFNGASASTDNVASIPGGLTTLRLGRRDGGGDALFGWLTRFAFYNRRLPNTELQRLTA